MSNLKHKFGKYLLGCLGVVLLLVACIASETEIVVMPTDVTSTLTLTATKVSALDEDFVRQTPSVEAVVVQPTTVIQTVSVNSAVDSGDHSSTSEDEGTAEEVVASTATPIVTATPTQQTQTESEVATSSAVTISSQETDSASILLALLSDPECKLPCYFGFTPGVSQLSEIQTWVSSLTPHSSEKVRNSHVELLTVFTDAPFMRDNRLRKTYIFQADTLIEIDSLLPDTPRFSITSLLDVYDLPAEITLETYDYRKFENVEDPVFRFKMSYPDDGFIVGYDMQAGRTPEQGTVCLDEVGHGWIAIWDTSRDRSAPSSPLILESHIFQMERGQPLVSTTDFTIESFREAVLSSQSQFCFETPFELWPEFPGSG